MPRRDRIELMDHVCIKRVRFQREKLGGKHTICEFEWSLTKNVFLLTCKIYERISIYMFGWLLLNHTKCIFLGYKTTSLKVESFKDKIFQFFTFPIFQGWKREREWEIPSRFVKNRNSHRWVRWNKPSNLGMLNTEEHENKYFAISTILCCLSYSSKWHNIIMTNYLKKIIETITNEKKRESNQTFWLKRF